MSKANRKGAKKPVELRALKCMCVVWRTGKIWPKQIADCARVENLTSRSAIWEEGMECKIPS